MKRIFTLALTALLIVSTFVTAYSLESGITSFSISPIEADQKHKYLYISVTAPETVEGSTLLVGFFTDGSLTRLTPLDISTKKQFTNQKINTYVTIKDPAGNYFLDQTPDEIKIFTWDKTSLAPRTLCDSVLTPEVIREANADVVESLKIVPLATQYIRKNCLVSEEKYINGEADEWDDHIFPIMDYIDTCAAKCIADAENHLMMSLYAQNQYDDELSQIRTLASNAPKRQKEKLKDLLKESVIGKEYYTALNNAVRFLNFSLTEV